MRDAVQVSVFLALVALLACAFPHAALNAPEGKTSAPERPAFCSYATVDAATWAELLNAVRPTWRSHGETRMGVRRMDADVPGLDAPLPDHDPLPFSAVPPPPPVFVRPWAPASQPSLATESLAAPAASALPPMGAFAPAAPTAPAHARAEMLSLDAFESLKRKGNGP